MQWKYLLSGEVEFKDVHFSYEKNGPEILKGVSFHVSPGQTFCNCRPDRRRKVNNCKSHKPFYNLTSGKILIDSHDINKVTIESLRKQMGVMMQDSFIFSGTIMDNIRYGNSTATDEQVVTAAKTVCAHEFIRKLEDGYKRR